MGLLDFWSDCEPWPQPSNYSKAPDERTNFDHVRGRVGRDQTGSEDRNVLTNLGDRNRRPMERSGLPQSQISDRHFVRLSFTPISMPVLVSCRLLCLPFGYLSFLPAPRTYAGMRLYFLVPFVDFCPQRRVSIICMCHLRVVTFRKAADRTSHMVTDSRW